MIAIVVALSISTILLGFAALAVDLGMAYERQSVLQSVADRLALAGAQGLPSTTTALADVQQALTQMCTTDGDTKNTPGICPAPANWMRDSDLSNGEVRFYADTGVASILPTDPASFLPYGVTEAQGIRVVLPPSKVTFGFAGVFTSGSASVGKSATARIGSALGAGILPFALSSADLNSGQFCVVTGATPGTTLGPPQRSRRPFVQLGFAIGTPDHVPSSMNRVGVTLTLTSTWPLTNVDFHATNSGAVLPKTAAGANTWSVKLPSSGPGTKATIWATGTAGGFVRGGRFTSNAVTVSYDGTPQATPDPCGAKQLTVRSASYENLARSSLNPGSDTLTSNIRTSPQVRLYPTGGLAGTVGGAQDCVSSIFSPATTCLSSVLGNFAQDLTSGLFSSAGNAPGRLDHDCGQGTAPVPGEPGLTADDSRLLSGGAPAATSLVDTSKTDPETLLDHILFNLPVQQGWVTSRALRCGRMAVLPVINSQSANGAVAGQSIVSFTYVWIDDIAGNQQPTGDRGITWSNDDTVASMQGYVINPGYLPSQVAGSLTVGPYLGAYMPKEALLVHDLGAPAS